MMEAKIHIDFGKEDATMKDREVIQWVIGQFWLHPDLVEMQASPVVENRTIKMFRRSLPAAMVLLGLADDEEQIIELATHFSQYTGWFIQDPTAGVMETEYYSPIYCHPQSGFWYHAD